MKRAVRFVFVFLIVATVLSVAAMVMLSVVVGQEPPVPARATLVLKKGRDHTVSTVLLRKI